MLHSFTYNVKAILASAHAMTRAALEQSSGANYSATFAAALRIAWKSAKADALRRERLDNAERDARATFDRWAAMDGAEQADTIRAAVWSAAARIGQYSGQTAEQVLVGDMWEYINETFVRIGDALNGTPEQVEKITARNRERAEQGKGALTVGALLQPIAARAIACQIRDTVKHVNALHVAENEDGEQISYIDLVPAHGGGGIDGTILRLAIEQFLSERDELDRAIFAERRNGDTMEQIGRRHNVTKMAVSKRLKKMRADLRLADII